MEVPKTGGVKRKNREGRREEEIVGGTGVGKGRTRRRMGKRKNNDKRKSGIQKLVHKTE
jgi:hypothetical protein